MDTYTEEEFMKDLDTFNSVSLTKEDIEILENIYDFSDDDRLIPLVNKALTEDLSKSQLKAIIYIMKVFMNSKREAVIEDILGILETLDYKKFKATSNLRGLI